MRLYEVDEGLREALECMYAIVDENDGVIPEDVDDYISELEIERERLVVYLGQEVLNHKADSLAYKTQKDKFAGWQKTAEGKSEWIKNYICSVLNEGEVIKGDSVRLSWRKSDQVLIDESVLPDEYWKVKKEPAKADIKAIIKAGGSIAGAEIVTKQNLQIK